MNDESASEMILGRQTDWDDLTKRVLGLFDQPAYIRRALRVDDAVASLHQRLAKQYQEQLRPVRIALAAWHKVLAHDPRAIKVLDETLRIRIAAMEQQLPPNPEPIPATTSRWIRPTRILDQLLASMDEFNRRWRDYIGAVDVSMIDRRIDEHNQYYLIEKECAFRSPRAAARGYRPMAAFDRRQLFERFPLLPTC